MLSRAAAPRAAMSARKDPRYVADQWRAESRFYAGQWRQLDGCDVRFTLKADVIALPYGTDRMCHKPPYSAPQHEAIAAEPVLQYADGQSA